MTDLETGIAIGMLLAQKTGETPDPEHDSDYWKWLTLSNPKKNQAVFLIRVTDATMKANLRVNPYSFPIIYADAFSVDWGDGSNIETFSSSSTPELVSHTYSHIGEYEVTFTNILGYNDYVISASTSNFIMAKYGDNMCVHSVKSGGSTSSANFKNYSMLRYVKLPPATEFNSSFFQSCSALKTIEFDGIITTLYQGMFAYCRNLDFSSIKFGDIANIPQMCFAYCTTSLETISLPACELIGNGAFLQCYNLKNASFPNCTTVEKSAFSDCYSLKSFTAASNCTYGTDCFKRCYKLSPRPDGTQY